MAISGNADAEDLLDYLSNAGISKYDMPEFFLRVVEFPMTPSGKILKRELSHQVRRGELHPLPVRLQSTEKRA